MFKLFGGPCRRQGPEAGWIKRGRVVGFGNAGAAIWGVIGCTEIRGPYVSAEIGVHAGLRGR
jgi:hypothetical protein